MAANVETMMYVREKPWHGIGTMVTEAPTSADALRLAGLDWQVEQTPVFTETGMEIPNYKANVRSTDRKVLGIVTDKYQIVQNAEAFEFTDSIVGETENGVVTYETAGSLAGGKKIWLLAKMPTQKILDDDIEPYMVFSNTHDGSGAIRIAMTPIRVVCQNTLNLALNHAKRQWSTKHMGNMQSKLEEARLCLQLADKYMHSLDIEADRLANATLRKEQIDEILDELFPIDDNATDRKKRNVQSMKDDFYVAYFMPDILKFGESAYRAVNAMSDVVTHARPKRNTANFNENRWGKIMDGHVIMDQFVDLVNKKIAV
jgi:phage/plasmid-like protein (TIGR03299 family)